MKKFLFVILILSASIYNVCAFNILAIMSLPLKSHYMAFDNFFRELAKRGHHVTVINNYPDQKPTANLTFVKFRDHENFITHIPPTLTMYEESHSQYWRHYYSLYRFFNLIQTFTISDCANFFNSQHVKRLYSIGIKYDVILVEQFVSDCGLAYVNIFYDAPIIGITSQTLLPWFYPRLGIPFDVSTDAFYFSPTGPNPPLLRMVENYFMNLLFNTFGLWYHHHYIYKVFNEFLPNNLLDVERAAREKLKMLFVYQHFSLVGSRLHSPQVLEIAGLHITKPKPVSEAVEKYLSSAKNGVIYVNFGSNLKASSMSSKKRQEFLNAFKRWPQKVLWKYENASFTQKNVYTGDWFRQIDVLCHPKVVGFVSHGGMLGLSEATYCGKPVVVVPFFGDQYSNAAAARAAGLGTVLMFDKLNAETLTDAVREVLKPRIQENVKKLSLLWLDRPLSSLDSAIYWTEYVARHGTGPPPLPAQWFSQLFFKLNKRHLTTISPDVINPFFTFFGINITT